MDSVGAIRGKAPGDSYSDLIDEDLDDELSEGGEEESGHMMDRQKARETLSMLLSWFYLERDKQAENRLQMALDSDFYDNKQWSADDEAEVRSRGQMPLVYNEVAPMIDWLIGTERRTRADWKVLPRTEDDVKIADVKTKTLKYVSDINDVVFHRSRAFGDMVKVGLGWLEDGARDDPTQDALFSKYRDWRTILHDSSAYELDFSDGRYIFDWRWVDEDIAIAKYSDRADAIRAACNGNYPVSENDEDWYMGERLDAGVGRPYGSNLAVDVQRRRVKLIQCQYYMPTDVNVVMDGRDAGHVFDLNDKEMLNYYAAAGMPVEQRSMMRMHYAVFTEADMIRMDAAPYRHNKFSLTPLVCYRRGNDRMVYGAVRRARDIQQDLNKRASKALFQLNTNQIIAEEGAVADPVVARYEADRPDGYIVVKKGKRFELVKGDRAAQGQLEMMQLDAQSIQKTAGINNENLGRATNAVSGAAIEARQIQGAVGTTEPFDNLRYATKCQGQKQLSLTEQFYTKEKVIRLTDAKGAFDWVKINTPERQPDGSVRYLNDITASQADFVVSEQDYAGTFRQVMFEGMANVAAKFPPEVALRIMSIAMQFSDFPNKDEIVDSLRAVTGERDPNKELTPEEQQQEQMNQAMQMEAMQMQREHALLALKEQQIKVQTMNVELQQMISAGQTPEVERAIRQIQAEANEEIDRVMAQLRRAQMQLIDRSEQTKANNNAELIRTRIETQSRERIALIQTESDKKIAALQQMVAALSNKEQEAA